MYDPTRAPRYPSPALFRPEADRITIHGPGSTGDVSGMRVLPERGSAPTDLDAFAGREIDIRNHGPVALGLDISPSQAIANMKTEKEAIAVAIQAGAGRLVYPSGDFVRAADPDATRNGVSYGSIVTGADGLRLHGQNTRLFSMGTDRTNRVGGVAFLNCSGACGLSGEWTFDVLNPMYAQGTCTHITDTHFEFALDWQPTFGDVILAWSYSDPDKRIAKGLFVGFGASNRPGLPLTNVSGLIYRLARGGGGQGAGPVDAHYLAIGDRAVLIHEKYGPSAVYAERCETLIVPAGVKILGSLGMAVRGDGAEVRYDGTIQARPGRFLAAVADGVHVIDPRHSVVAGRIFDCADDAINLQAANAAIIAQPDATHITVTYPNDVPIPPRVGDLLDVVDGNRQRQASLRVVGLAAAGDTCALTLAGPLTAATDASWRIVNRTANDMGEIRSVVGQCFGGGARISGTRHVIDLDATATTKAPILLTTFFDREYGPEDLIEISLVARDCNVGGNFSDYAAVLVYPTKLDGVTAAGKGSYGTIDIKRLHIHGCGSRVISVTGASKVFIRDVDLKNFNLSAGIDNRYLGDFYECGSVTIQNATADARADVYLRGCGSYSASQVHAIKRPGDGAGLIRAPTDGLQDFTPSWMYSESGQVLFSSALKYCVDEDNIVEISGSYRFTQFPAGGSPRSWWPLPVQPTTDGLMFGADMTTGSALVGTVSAQDVTVSFIRLGGGTWGADGETVQVSGRYRC